jgi:AcrR family transcriptional regulator
VTREAIVVAALDRLRHVRPEHLAYVDVAEAAGVALRTAYRHFPTLDDLLAAALQTFLQQVVGPTGLQSRSPAEFAAAIEKIHARLSAEPGLYRLFFALPARTGVGMTALVLELCRDALARIPAEHHAAVCAVVELMLGPYAWEVFHTHWSVPPAAMTRTLLASVQLLLDGFSRSPHVLAASSPSPPLFHDRVLPRAAAARL